MHKPRCARPVTALTGKSPKSFVQNAIRMAVDSRVTRVAETFKYVTARPGALHRPFRVTVYLSATASLLAAASRVPAR
ncbi:hypothetical protein MOKP4_50190 [Mycobacterium avium subsp. hominissuis]|uniref:Uncharacterized protein n=1 Tax=Mycobacterium avium subsp. hominissuis TaxID=439334 RepID=A0AAI8SPR0_MYCAV|nr:hypothetical protein JPH1_35350 [Mycobacterium avium subsp. hominissuis]